MSNVSRGKTWERRVRKYLESLKFQVDTARAALKWTPRGMVSSPCDILGCADHVGIHRDLDYTLFVQCTLGNIGPRKEKMEAIGWRLPLQRVQIWAREESIRGGARVLNMLRLKEDDSIAWQEHFFRMKDGEWPAGGIL